MLRLRSAPMSPFITFLLYTALDAEPKLEPIAAPKHSLDDEKRKFNRRSSWSSREWIAWCVQIASITSLFIQILAELNGSVQGAHKWYTDIILSVDSGMFLHAIACYAPGPHEKHQNQCSLSKLSRHQLKESSDALAKPTPPMMGKRHA